MSVSKKLRFKVFERDGFTCQYCGKQPPEVVLEPDHMVSVKDGGLDDNINLITACFACNRGKSSKSVDVEKMRGKKFKKELKELEEKKDQLYAYYEFIKRKKEIELEEMDIFQDCWQRCSNQKDSLTSKGLRDIKNNLCTKYKTEMILSAIEITWDNDTVDVDSKFKYMCGVLKNLNPDNYG